MEQLSTSPGPAALKALAHPVRLRLLGLLRSEGPATATALAARLGVNSGSTSYHLRQLAAHGFVVDDPQRGTGRERWWKAAHRSTHAPEVGGTPQEQAAVHAFTQAVAIGHTEELQLAVAERPSLPRAWQEASTVSDWHLRLTPARARALRDAVQELVGGWAEDPADAEGAAEFVLAVHAYPRPGAVLTRSRR